MKRFFESRFKEKPENRGEGSSNRDFSKDSMRRAEMNNELPDKNREAKAGFRILDGLNKKSDLTDNDISIAISTGDPIKAFYKKYQKCLNMDTSTYKTLTGEYTKQRNTWHSVRTPGTYVIYQTDAELAVMRHQVIKTIHDFVQSASRDLQDRVNPGSAVRAQIRNEVKEAWKYAMEQRWREVLGEGREIPNYDSPEWAEFVSEEHGNILEAKELELGSRGAHLISDIMIGGKINEIRDIGDRDSTEYRNYMSEIYERYQNFSRRQGKQAATDRSILPSEEPEE